MRDNFKKTSNIVQVFSGKKETEFVEKKLK